MLTPRARTRARRRSQSGQALVILTIFLLLLIGIAGLAADGGHVYLVKRNVQNAADASALAAGRQLASSGAVLGAPPTASSDSVPTAANGFAANNGFSTALSNQCDMAPATHTSFSTTWVDTGVCTSPGAATTVITVNDPPIASADGTPPPSACAQSGKYNCFQVVISTKVHNFLMGLFGIPTTTVTADAVVDASPPGNGYDTPAPIALNLYEPATIFDTANPPLRTQLSCAVGSVANTTTCPTFWTENGSPIISGVDGQATNSGLDTVALQSAGHMVIQGQTTICDPYGGATCAANKAVGALGFATGPSALTYCKQLNGAVSGCTTTGQAGLQPLWGKTTAYTSTSWTPTVTTSGPDCGSLDLVLNGGTVVNATIGQNCAASAEAPYTILAGTYHSITINHGTYEFQPGLFDIKGTAPVYASAGCAGTYTATGIDHCRETGANDPDLCSSPSGCTLTAGVWIGHGGGSFGAFVAPTAGSCTGGTPGTDGGGGDPVNVSGVGVTFLLEPTAGGFVSTGDVNSVGLSAPGLGSSLAVNNVPLLIDEQNSSFIHLDAGTPSPPPKGQAKVFSQFSGIIYQTATATGGGVEMDAGLSHNNGGGLLGQVLAYSFATWGTGTAVDFSDGFGQSSSPTITTSGHAENGIITTPSPSVKPAADPAYSTFTVTYADEWALDGYDTYIRVNGATPVFFSQNEWGPQPIAGSALPPQGPVSATNPNGNNNPNDYNGTPTPPSMAAWPVYPSAAGTVTYPNAAAAGYTVSYDSKRGEYDDWTETLVTPTQSGGSSTSYFETLGAWTWGHQKDIASQTSSTYTATIRYTFPTPPGSSVALSIFLTDGDHCGDYASASYSFANSGAQIAGSVELLR